jgi:hypothetical protein
MMAGVPGNVVAQVCAVLAAKTANAIAINQGPLAVPSRPRSCRDVALSLNSGPS